MKKNGKNPIKKIKITMFFFLGEIIPIRLYLSGYELTPSYKSISGKFSVKYYLNLVLIDEEDRRYFKQQEIQLWRKRPAQAHDK